MYHTVAGFSFSRGIIEAKQLLVATGTVGWPSTCSAWSITLDSKACPKMSRSDILLEKKNGATVKAQGCEMRLVKPELFESCYLKALHFLACKWGIICKGCSKDLWSVLSVLSDRWVESAARVQTSYSGTTHKYCQVQPYLTLRQALSGFFPICLFCGHSLMLPHHACDSRAKKKRVKVTSSPSCVCCQCSFCEMSETPQVLKWNSSSLFVRLSWAVLFTFCCLHVCVNKEHWYL